MKGTLIFALVIVSISSIYCFYRPSQSITLPSGFSYLTDIDPTIKIQARYAIPQNFRGDIIKGYLKPTVIMTTAAATALRAVQQTLR